MKKVLWLGMAFTLMLALCSCTLSGGEQYNNFIDDLDVITRLETALQQQKDGGMSLYVAADMETLEDDLSTLKTANEELLRINEKFVEATRLLRESQRSAAEEDWDASKLSYLKAKARFDAGTRLLYSLPMSEGGAANE